MNVQEALFELSDHLKRTDLVDVSSECTKWVVKMVEQHKLTEEQETQLNLFIVERLLYGLDQRSAGVELDNILNQ